MNTATAAMGRGDTPARRSVLTTYGDVGSVLITQPTQGDTMPSGDTITIAAAARQLTPVPATALRECLDRKRRKLAASTAAKPRPAGIPWPLRTAAGLEVFDLAEWSAYTVGYLIDQEDGEPVVSAGTPAIGYDIIAAWLHLTPQVISRLWSWRNRHIAGLGCPPRSAPYAGLSYCCPTPEAAAVKGPRWHDIPAAVGRRGNGENDGPMFLPADICKWAMATSRLEMDGVTPMTKPPIGRPRRADSARSQTRRRRAA